MLAATGDASRMQFHRLLLQQQAQHFSPNSVLRVITGVQSRRGGGNAGRIRAAAGGADSAAGAAAAGCCVAGGHFRRRGCVGRIRDCLGSKVTPETQVAQSAAVSYTYLHSRARLADALIPRSHTSGRKGSGGQSLRDLHVAAGDWLYAQRGAAALGAVSRHYAAGINAEGLYHGKRCNASAESDIAAPDAAEPLHLEAAHAHACRALAILSRCCRSTFWIQTCMSGAPEQRLLPPSLKFRRMLAAVLSDGFDPAKARDWDLYVCRAFLLVRFEP